MSALKQSKIKCVLAGAATGIVNGFFGGGGGMILIPLLICWIGLEERRAFATCVCIILPLCIVSSCIYFFRSPLNFADAWPYLLGGLAGGIIAGQTFQKVPTAVLRKALAILIIYGGVRSLFWS
jgi:Predicted permeases